MASANSTVSALDQEFAHSRLNRSEHLPHLPQLKAAARKEVDVAETGNGVHDIIPHQSVAGWPRSAPPTSAAHPALGGPVPLADPAAVTDERTFLFGPFRLLARHRLLLEGDRPLRLGGRALDILIALVERPGEVVGKSELMRLVWPDTVVVEANLAVHVAALRRALGDGQAGIRYIINVPGRGYCFAAPVAYDDQSGSLALPPAATERPHNLPAQLRRLIGRAKVVGTLAQHLSGQRLLTIVGPGGIGKTAVALEVAEKLLGDYEHGVWLIDLAPLADPRLVPTALASVLELEIQSDNPLPGLVAALRDKEMLLVLDNCEHVIDAAATLTAAILRGASRVRILATSREPLRVVGERVHRLATLESPPASLALRATEALMFPAVQLFVERAAATMSEFELSDADAPSAVEICSKLDGIPLAIEFAAARVAAFGVRGLAAHLDDRLRLSMGCRRAALPRQRTVSATIDWSYHLLSEREQCVFRRLAIFAGGFTLEAACAVAADAEARPSDIVDIVTDLVTKSLVVADVGGGGARFRLLETTRAYAATKLEVSDETDVLARRHASYFRDLLKTARNSPAEDSSAAGFAPEIDNVRAALTWAFGPRGDGSIAAELAAASAPMWLEMSLLTECHGWMERALDRLDAADRGARLEMVLQSAFGLSLMFTEGTSNRTRAALTRANELAESVEDFEYQLRALVCLSTFCFRREKFQDALALARRSEAIAKRIGEPSAISTADFLLSGTLMLLGDYAGALTHAQRGSQRITAVARRAHIVRGGLNHSLSLRPAMVQVLWLQGLPDQSAQMTRDLLADARAVGDPLSLCVALTWCGCPVSLRNGDLEAAEHSIARLKNHADDHGLTSYYACGLGYEGQLYAQRGDLAAGERLLRSSLAGLHQTSHELLYTPFLSGLAEVLATAGRLDESLAAADEALRRTERSDGFWWMPEALRIKGAVLLLSDAPNAPEAEDHFRRSLDLAHRQGALSWELRTAMSLARLHHAQGRPRDGRELLHSVYARFTEGFETADLRCARRLLEEWDPGGSQVERDVSTPEAGEQIPEVRGIAPT